MAGGVGGIPPQIQKRGRAAYISNPTTSGAQYAGKPSANGGGQKGVEGAQAPSQGVWGMCPQNKKGGRVAHISHPATSGTQDTGKPSANGGGQMGGGGGASPLPGGLGDVPPKIQKKGRAAHISNPAHEWGQIHRQTLSQRGWAKGGGGGASPLDK